MSLPAKTAGSGGLLRGPAELRAGLPGASCGAVRGVPRLAGGPRAASILRTPPGSEGSKGQHALAGARGPLIPPGAEGGPVNVSQEGGADAARQELDQLRERMAAVKKQAAAEVDENWKSPIRTEDLFDIKVKQKLANNDEYQTLQARIREAEGKLATE